MTPIQTPLNRSEADFYVFGVNPSTGARIEPGFKNASPEQIEMACAQADASFAILREISIERRARFLETIATKIEDLGTTLVRCAHEETGLSEARLTGEVGRTTNQLRFFAAVLREGSWLGLRCDSSLPDRSPLPRPDLRLRHVPLGPVMVFGASNFPLAFSVAGGDTASALAAGCPVIVKAHEAHPGTSKLVGDAVCAAAREAGFPDGTFSMLFVTREAAQALVRDKRIKAVGFTGSRAGGLALCEIAAGRPEPIPVYAEMSSTNPVFLLPEALATRGKAIARGFVDSLTLGAGQFCTNPGVVFAVTGAALDAFIAEAGCLLAAIPSGTMLSANIQAAYRAGVGALSKVANVAEIARGKPETGPTEGQAALFVTDSETYLQHEQVRAEIFGSASIIVKCRDVEELFELATRIEGQLTATLFLEDGDYADASALVPILETKVGRILANGYPTGVEVAHAMVHGGPFPATSDARSTSVGSLAIQRFLRPVCYQNLPQDLLPAELRDDRSSALPWWIDGALSDRN